jgi:L-lysine 2,3-aminomutase
MTTFVFASFSLHYRKYIVYARAGTREQHLAEIQQLESLVSAAREMAARQTRRFSQHMDKLSLADRVIRQLLSENEELLTSLLVLQVSY